ncbi:uncharacterized protein LACBIDRAFT_312217 [Laccaria bicolor S238N-H82]|uniref:Predicted protein n=1 Tax=Laccaria bicolor (strain S238N-H82 / ATCC MYA-4686) TaxID=486041 RepID=B0DVR1_LACBS|nr:uncharacterized protein LACBIDRAFT_312217 [Laccaria bicolor S238N-H82]EDR01296.1 predicted protein [Laccaria bicolor S238N-H82]|eukprot:XP_001888003.1 predicted protein [Laccaria bicolor S238N-H82]
MTSYKTRQSSYGEPTGCMQGTRVKVLEELDIWASDANSSRVYWMVGMAGIGKSTIAHTFCENLEAKNILGGSFFASRASEKTRNARLIIPVIAHSLARASPAIKVEVVKAIEDDPTLAETTYSNIKEQFKRLIYDPVQTTVGGVDKVVVIDAIDECANLEVVTSFIKLVLELASKTPLKVFLTSRDEYRIRKAFESGDRIRFCLHEIEKDVVKNDIQTYLDISLARIKENDSDEWPSSSELSVLVKRSGTLFIYAATAVRYITNGDEDFKSRLSAMVIHGQKSISKFETDIDSLYIHVLEKVCEGKELHEVAPMRDLLLITIFLRNPLSMEALTSLSLERNTHSYLSRLCSVIHIPDQPGAVVAPFHASFPDFITDPKRCSPERFSSERSAFPALDASEGHKLIALKCLEQMNRSLKYNICEIPKELTVFRRGRTNSPQNIDKISEVLKYSCIYWAAHLAEVKKFDCVLVEALRVFLHKHLLHWIECLSILGELQTGLKYLGGIMTLLSLLVHDARRCLQMNFEAVQKHCMGIYESALTWIPKNSVICKTYIADVSRVPKVTLGLSDSWDPAELILQNGSLVLSVAFSQDGSRVISGSYNGTLRIWNVTTGKVEAELKGHTGCVNSVAFSQDGSQVVSGSNDKTVQIWNVTMGEVEAKLKGHTDFVRSVAFSQDSSQVVSGSDDKTVRIWNVTTGEVEAKLKGHTDLVRSVAFSQDSSQVVSGSDDKTVRIWNVTTGEVEAELNGHTDLVKSVAFSQDSSQVVSGSDDKTVRIWNVTTGKVEAELKGHTDLVNSVAFSQDGSQVVSGSNDKTVRIWNVTTGEVEAELKGHTDFVRSVAFSQDSSQVVSGSDDKTVRIWNVTTGEVEAELNGHTDCVRSVAFSQDSSQVVSGSDDKTVRIWNVTTGEVEAELKGHTDLVSSVAFSQDSSRVVSGSDDKTVRIWNVTTGEPSRLWIGDKTVRIWNVTMGEVEAELKGHTNIVRSVAFSQDGSRVVSGSHDKTVQIWNVMTGEVEAELKGHTDYVISVAFSQDGSRIVSGSNNKTVRVWNVTMGKVEAELTGHTVTSSVAFSQDGSQVIFGSHHKTVQIWNLTTGNSQAMLASNITLPDDSRVNKTGHGEFHISYPLQQPTLSMNSSTQLSNSGDWIMANLRDCCIPSQYRKFRCSSIWGSRICLGYQSGRVVIVDMNVAL